MTTKTPARRKLSIVSVPVSDQSRAKQFYTEVLDFDLVRDHPMGDGDHRLVLETDDVDRDSRLLRERGAGLDDPNDAPWGRFTEFRDPDGNQWVLQQSTREGSD